jgi:hypothetical protein
MTDPIEAAAKAAYEAYWISCAQSPRWDLLNARGRMKWARVARAVLKAAEEAARYNPPCKPATSPQDFSAQ